MRILGNILLIPFKILLLLAYIIATIGVVLSIIFDAFSTIILSKLISICIIIILASALFYGTSFTDNSAAIGILISFILIFIIAIIPLLIKELQTIIKNGLSFWF